MTPEDILRDALAKIERQRCAAAERLNIIQAEAVGLEQQIAEATRAETALAAILSGEAATWAPPAAEPEHVEQPLEPAPAIVETLMEAGASIAEASVRQAEPEAPTAAGEPTAEAAPALGADELRDRALSMARANNPERTERQVRMLAAAAVREAFALPSRGVATDFGINVCDLGPSNLRGARITDREVWVLARALKEPAPVAEAAPAPAPEPAQVAPPAEPDAFSRDLADDLLTDLPKMLQDCPAGVSVATIAEWFGCEDEQARDAALLLIHEGKAIAQNKLLRLPAGEAVPA